MKKLKDYKKELSKCSKCGLCQTVCPIYNITKNECAVSRGKFIMLYGVTKGNLKLSKNINKHLDMCLKCGKCKEFCPSDIDVCTILNIAKYEYMKQVYFSKIINFLQSKVVFSNLINFLKLFNRSKASEKSSKKNSQNNTKVTNLLYFKGCVNQILPNTDKSLKKILNNVPVNVIEKDFDCCGLPFLSEGNVERFIEAANTNMDKINSVQDFDYLVSDCASCESTLRCYTKYLGDDCSINSVNFLNWGDFIAQKNIKFKYNKSLKITFHKPCHLENDDFFENIINNCSNITYSKMEEYDTCCGFAGTFGIKNRKLSKIISKKKGQNISQTNADYVVTSCPSCLMGLKQGLILNKNFKTKVISLLDFLAMADEISI